MVGNFEDYSKLKDILFGECREYLEYLSVKGNDILLRGVNKQYIDLLTKKTVRMDRNSLSTPQHISDLIDDFIERKVGYRLRSQSLFCSTSGMAKNYGNVYMVFPIGYYEIFNYGGSLDLWNSIEGFEWYKIFRYDFDPREDRVEKILPEGEDIDEFVERMRAEMEEDIDRLTDGINTGNPSYTHGELSLICDEYYLVDIGYKKMIEKIIKEYVND